VPDRVILVLFPGAIAYELATAADVLGRKLRVEVATPSGADHVDESGLVYRARWSFTEVPIDECRAVVVAGGGLLSIKDDEALNALLRAADARRLVIGAICAGPLALAQAGILRGHRYTQSGLYPASDQWRWDGAEQCAQQLVVSGHIITAVPEAHIDFAIELGRHLGVFPDDAEAERKRDYYKGRHERDWSKVGPIAGL
jgi:protein deglycase